METSTRLGIVFSLLGYKTGQAPAFSYTDANKSKGIHPLGRGYTDGVSGESQKVSPKNKK